MTTEYSQVVDLLNHGPLRRYEMVALTGIDQKNFTRILRCLRHRGLITTDDFLIFRLTPRGQLMVGRHVSALEDEDMEVAAREWKRDEQTYFDNVQPGLF